MMRHVLILLGALFVLTQAGCTQHKVEVAPVEIKPIHITIDVNVKVAQDLNDFFKDIDAEEEKLYKKATSEE
jgi:Skp family chaperone for outer membrane proteins